MMVARRSEIRWRIDRMVRVDVDVIEEKVTKHSTMRTYEEW